MHAAAIEIVARFAVFVVAIPHVSRRCSHGGFELMVLSPRQEIHFKGQRDAFLPIVICSLLVEVGKTRSHSKAPMGFRGHAPVERNAETLECRFPTH